MEGEILITIYLGLCALIGFSIFVFLNEISYRRDIARISRIRIEQAKKRLERQENLLIKHKVEQEEMKNEGILL